MDKRAVDGEILRLRVEHCDDPPRRLRLGLLFGRYRVVEPLRQLLAPEEYRRFLRERALPQVPIGGDARRGFAVDEVMLREIAAALDEPLEPLLAATVRWMRDRGSRHLAKLYVLARLSGDPGLIAELQPSFDARAAQPRRSLPAEVRQRFSAEVLQAGDDDDYNPRSASLFSAEGVVLKEHLRLHLDPADPGGYSQERALLQALRHPHLVKLLDVALVRRHELLVLERVRGETLEARAHPAARLILRQLTELLAWLHAQEVLYLDVKPKNLLFDGEHLTLCDLGMARRGKQVTSMLSTLEYVPPEMARDFTASDRSDVFQLGIVFHQLLTGRHPFSDGEGVEVALANLWDEPRTDDPLIRAMLAKDPAERPSAADVLARLP